jgi:hypothetical protein
MRPDERIHSSMIAGAERTFAEASRAAPAVVVFRATARQPIPLG